MTVRLSLVTRVANSNLSIQTSISNVRQETSHPMPLLDVLLLSSSLSPTTRSLWTLLSSETQGTVHHIYSCPSLSLMHCRRIELETKLTQIHSSDAKEREIRKYGRTESQHLRLKRTKIKLDDFITVKVIGKGAFGEVRSSLCLL